MVLEVESASQFDQILAENEFVFVDFFATWCGPCRMIAPTIETLSGTHSKVKFVKVDVEKVPELTSRYGISAMPTFLAFKKGQRVGNAIMGANKAAIETLLVSL